jgi:hypothetical protein
VLLSTLLMGCNRRRVRVAGGCCPPSRAGHGLARARRGGLAAHAIGEGWGRSPGGSHRSGSRGHPGRGGGGSHSRPWHRGSGPSGGAKRRTSRRRCFGRPPRQGRLRLVEPEGSCPPRPTRSRGPVPRASPVALALRPFAAPSATGRRAELLRRAPLARVHRPEARGRPAGCRPTDDTAEPEGGAPRSDAFTRP